MQVLTLSYPCCASICLTIYMFAFCHQLIRPIASNLGESQSLHKSWGEQVYGSGENQTIYESWGEPVSL